MKYDKKAKGMIPIEDLHNIIMDLLIEEYKEIDKHNYHQDEDVYFNLHKKKVATLYLKWKVMDNQYQVDEEAKRVLTKIYEETPELKDFKRNKRLQRHLERYMRKFIGSIEIPVYNRLKDYNFHDTLEGLLKRMFSEEHIRNYHERLDRIAHTTDPKELPKYDRIEPNTSEYWELDLIEQEEILEKTNEDFQLVLTRLEKKPEEELPYKIQALEKMMDIRSKQAKKTRKNHQIDIFNGNIIDSSQILGANIIIKFIERKKKSLVKRLTRRGTNKSIRK